MPEKFKTTCCYCGVGCGVVVNKERDGRLWVEGDAEHPVNKGMLCSKGMNLHYTVMDRGDRLLYPEVRYNRYQPRQRVSWDEALSRTAAAFAAIIQQFGPQAVAFYASGQCLTEEYYVVNKLIKGFIGSNNIDTNSRLCMSSAVAAYKMALGEDIVPGCYDDIEQTDCLFIAGANPAWCHPILWRRVEAAKAANPNLVIIVSDPRVTQTCSLATLHLQVMPGTDIVLHHAIGRVILEEGYADAAFIQNHTEGFEAYRETVMQRTLYEAALICGVEVKDIAAAAHAIGGSARIMTMWTMGLNQSAVGVNKNLSLINLHLITGTIGKPGCGPFSLTGQPNAMGGREVGGLSNLLPAHRDLLNAQHREEVQRYWGGTAIDPRPGLTATQMFEALRNGSLKAIWIMGTNPLVSLPDVRMAEEGLKNARLVVVQEISNKPETLAYADVVLPAAAWAEKEGTMTNAERRITYLPGITAPPGEALPDAEILCRFARKMGYTGFAYNSMEEIYREHAGLTAGTHIHIEPLTYATLRSKRSVQWPYTGEAASAGTQRLFADHVFYTKSGKAAIHSFTDENTSEPASPQYPLILTTGRIRDQWHTMSKTGKVNKLKQHISAPFLEMHPADAAVRGIDNNDVVEVVSKKGNACIKVKITDTVREGLVFMPMHWGKLFGNDAGRANNLTHTLLDPVSKQPDFKFAAVQVSRYRKPVQRIIVVGAGAGAHAFARAHRAHNLEDSITVFSKEDQPFYNRVMLPDYISGTQQWQQLVKMTGEEEQELDVLLKRGVSITAVDTQAKTVTDNTGVVHTYDILLLAMGSRPSLLRDTPELKGIFTMRSRDDADRFRKHVKPENGKVVIVGGGLLGIEMAASLQEIGIGAILLQRSSKLMDRQLDQLGSRLLHEELTDRNIEILYNDEIDRYTGTKQLQGIQLKSGRVVDCQAVLFSIGTTPNIELAKAAGIYCKRGVVVDAYMQTSAEDVYAIGEIAEFNGVLYGITAAAEQQAGIVAAHLRGDISHYYQGSLFMNILKLHGADICSLGTVETPNDPGYEEVVFIDKSRRYYKKCVIHNDRLVGAILIGDRSEFLEFKDLIEQKIELSEKRLQLLRSGKKADPVLGRLICSCGNVGEGNICAKIKEGIVTLPELCKASGAGMGCGSCRSEVQAILTCETVAETV